MRIILILWAFPLVFFWGWYGLSANNLHFGFDILRREVHDAIFALYGRIIGVPAAEVPGVLAGVFAFDTALLLAIAAFRWRRSWLPQARQWASVRYDRWNEARLARPVGDDL